MRESAFRRRVLSATLLRRVASFGTLARSGAFHDLRGERARAGDADLDPLDAARVGVHHFEFEAVRGNDFAARRNMPRESCDEPPPGIYLLGVADRGEIGIDRAENLAKTGARVHDEISVRGGLDLRAFARIVFVLDIAANHSHAVLDRR